MSLSNAFGSGLYAAALPTGEAGIFGIPAGVVGKGMAVCFGIACGFAPSGLAFTGFAPALGEAVFYGLAAPYGDAMARALLAAAILASLCPDGLVCYGFNPYCCLLGAIVYLGEVGFGA